MKNAELAFKHKAYKMKIPRQVLVKDQIYTVKMVKEVPAKSDGKEMEVAGLCCPSEQILYIKTRMGKVETVRTLFHEILHAIEYEYGITMPHKLIYKLEAPLAQVIVDNFAS